MTQIDTQLQARADFHIRVYENNYASTALQLWFDTVFKEQNPSLHGDFEFRAELSPEGEEVWELVAFNPQFTIDALEELAYGSIKQTFAKHYPSGVVDLGDKRSTDN